MSAKSPARSAGPPSSPRLPSPPPLPELQLGPRSPSINATGGELSLEEAAAQDEGAARRIRPGTSAAEMAQGPPFVPLHQLETPFQLQEYLKSSYCDVTRDENSNTVKPITKESAMQLATPPIQQDTGDPVDRNLWLYELCRFLVQRTNRLIVSFFADNPPCSNQTCPEMRASEWQYLCAVHEPPKSCCAIDYCCHTLDWAANVLTSPKHFPSRLSLGGEGGSAYQSMRQLTNIFRRVYRIYAHAWFQHREAFWSLEQEEGLYKFFRTVCDAYSLIPEDNYTIPSEAEAEREDLADTPILQRQILKTEQESAMQQASVQEPESESAVPALGPTVRRHGHRHTPSTGTHVTMIAEGPEEEEESTLPQTKASPVQPQSLTALSEQLSSGPLKISAEPTPRSPRPTMSIPINDNRDDLRAPEDPTPTPERHASDPFADSAGVKATQEAAEVVESEEPTAGVVHAETTGRPESPEPAKSATAATGNEPPSKIAMPPLVTATPPRVINEDEEVLSPGGGSIRTVGSDILSGILAHVDNEPRHDFSPTQSHGTTAASVKETEITEPKQSETTEEQSKSDPAAENEGAEKKDEDLEEMGEIKLVETKILRDDHEEEGEGVVETSESKKDEGNVTNEEEKGGSSQDTRDDGTKTEETPSGVV